MDDILPKTDRLPPAAGQPPREFTAAFDDPQAFRESFKREGFAVVRGAVAASLCDTSTAAFEREVRPASRTFFLRHESGRYERHTPTEDGFMKFPVLNIPNLNGRRFAGFRNAGLEVLTHPSVHKALSLVFGEPPRMLHSMFFDGNQVTWAHRDSDYLDSTITGSLTGVIVAMEDIHPDAGRFYVYPRSHHIDPDDPEGRRLGTINPNTPEYKTGLVAWMKSRGLELYAPVLKKGDMVLFNGLVVHGSLDTTVRGRTRRSFNAHFIPDSHDFVLVRDKPGTNHCVTVNGMRITMHEDQNTFRVQLRETLNTDYPALHRIVKGVKGLFRKAA